MSSLIPSTSGERAILRIASILAEEKDGSSAVVSFVTLTEAHVDTCLRRLFILSGALDSELSSHLYREVQDSIHRTWESRYRWLSQAFDIVIRGSKYEQDFSLLVELRNSVVHGNGGMTDFQVAKVPQMIAIRTGLQRCLGLETQGRKFLLDRHIIMPAARICRDYIQEFDQTVKLKFPSFDI